MSDSEDYTLLDDIKALENALAEKNQSPSTSTSTTTEYVLSNLCEKSNSVTITQETQDDSASNSSFCVNENCLDIQKLNSLDDLQAALLLNKHLITCLQTTKMKFTTLLEECRKRKQYVEQKILQIGKSTSTSKVTFCNAGMPYFKDKDRFVAPMNEDAKKKKASGELQIVHLPIVCRWTPKDRHILINAIKQEAITDVLNNKKLPGKRKVSHRKMTSAQRIAEERANLLPKCFQDTVGPLGAREFDWLKIAATDFEGRHSAEECRVMWNIFLHPDINKTKWSKVEDAHLKQLAEQNKYENWDEIALKLKTRRSGYQCFIRFNTTNRQFGFKGCQWKKEEDQRLVDAVNKLRHGDFIPWGEVASCMHNRTKQQVYFRWTYSLAPHLKKGRFTATEDKILMNAVAKYGKNFGKIVALCMPNRTTVQLSDHYQTLVVRESGNQNTWSLEEDVQLIKLHVQYGSDWVKIAKHFPTKTRIHVRHRFSALLRYQRKNVSLKDIPRTYQGNLSATEIFPLEKKKTDEENVEIAEDEIDIDSQLLLYFKEIASPSKFKGTRKSYSSDEIMLKIPKLYNILQNLNANLVIPESLHTQSLSLKNKQLLLALKVYGESKATKGAERCESIKAIQQRMFGSEHNSDTYNHFVPPLPFNMICKTKNAIHQKTLEYDLNTDQQFSAEVNMQLETPENVISMIGINSHLEFEKVTRILIGLSRKIEKQTVIKKIYILPPQKKVNNSHGTKRHVANCSKDGGKKLQIMSFPPKDPSTSGIAVESSTKNVSQSDEAPWPRMFQETLPPSGYSILEPNYSTIFGFRNILSSKQMSNINDKAVDKQRNRLKYQPDGHKAFELLRQRLLKLFKIPVGMSQILPPEIHGGEKIFLSYAENVLKSKLKSKSKKVVPKKPGTTEKESRVKKERIDNPSETVHS
ncbi:uncharacterized protein LOC107265279 [Cephus cinctus]|uniref:Uncharacterized protein LOC107265279 n=1 Tax=Cephus cinctus TaxID=211228 RepID=A0AAJ7BMW0_CEPCN|nr:uncharacterized protein LOC107265279 [Cephus cinctus]